MKNHSSGMHAKIQNPRTWSAQMQRTHFTLTNANNDNFWQEMVTGHSKQKIQEIVNNTEKGQGKSINENYLQYFFQIFFAPDHLWYYHDYHWGEIWV